MPFLALPPHAAWQHCGSRTGFEVAFSAATIAGWLCVGCATGAQEDVPWIVDYRIELDTAWHTLRAQIRCRGDAGSDPSETLLVSDGFGHWWIDGQAAPELDGLLDVDLEASALTNTFPIHRLSLEVGQSADAPAAWVRAPGLRIERLEQHYSRRPDDGAHARFDYSAPSLDFHALLLFDDHGLVLDYPGIAIRSA